MGRSYGALLQRMGCTLSWVGRSVHSSLQVNVVQLGLRDQHSVQNGAVVDHIPDCDLVLVALRAEDVDATLLQKLSTLTCPLIMLSPLVSPAAVQRWQVVPNLIAATPALVANYEPPSETAAKSTQHAAAASEAQAGRLEFWVPPLSVTWLDTKGQELPAVRQFAERLSNAGARTRFKAQVLERSRALTTLFFPLQQALVQAPTLRDWTQRRQWLRSIARGFRRSRQLVGSGGPPELALRLAAALLSSAWSVGLLSFFLPRIAPRLAAFLEQHFGHKLRSQTPLFAAQLSEQARALNWSHAAVSELLLEDSTRANVR